MRSASPRKSIVRLAEQGIILQGGGGRVYFLMKLFNRTGQISQQILGKYAARGQSLLLKGVIDDVESVPRRRQAEGERQQYGAFVRLQRPDTPAAKESLVRGQIFMTYEGITFKELMAWGKSVNSSTIVKVT